MLPSHDPFQRPAAYWLKRAERCKQNGDLLRAAVMQRHALRADPASRAAATEYVHTLRMLGCYESSNREAFAVLARDPGHRELFGLVGLNMVSLGKPVAARDALNIYFALPDEAILPEWHDICELTSQTLEGEKPRRRKARLDGLLKTAARRIASGDTETAFRALKRAEKAPYRSPNAQRELLWALYHFRAGEGEACITHVMAAVSAAPSSTRVHAEACVLLQMLGQRQAAQIELLNALRFVSSPEDVLSALAACDRLNAPHLAKGMLRRLCSRRPSRLPLIHNLCAAELKLGNLPQAARHIHLCREIDPDDVSGEGLFARVMAMENAGLSPEQVRREARSIPWYGQRTRREWDQIAQPLGEAAAEGGPAAMMDDQHLRRHLLEMMLLDDGWTAELLFAVSESIPSEDSEALLREVLLQSPAPSAVKNCAVSLLSRMGAEEPYAAWQGEHLTWLFPSRAAGGTPAFREPLLTLRIHRAQRLCPGDQQIALWAMEQVHRMSRSQRSLVISDPARIWPMAFAIRYRHLRGMEPLHLAPDRLGRGRAWALCEALRLLRSLK